MADTSDVVVVGAGPGGCATALHLARRGHEVVLLDRVDGGVDDGVDGAGRPGGKVCGEGLMPHGRAALERLGVPTHTLGQPFVGIAYHAGRASAQAGFGAGRLGLGTRRSAFDPALRALVRAEPAIRVREGVRVTGLTGQPGAMRLATSAGPVTARVVVGAAGLHSTVRKLAGLEAPARGPRRYGARMHLRLAAGRREPEHVHVHAAGGWEAYLTPVGPGEVNVALLLGASAARRLKGDRDGGFRALVTHIEPLAGLFDGAEPRSDVAVCGPLRQRVRAASTDGVVLVGDAAGFVDAVTGEGMSLTLLSAELAAECVSAGLATGRLGRRWLGTYAERRRRLVRTLCTLTEVVVFGLRHPWWAERVVAALGRRSASFERFLAVQTGEGSLWSLAPALAGVTLAFLDPRTTRAVRAGLGSPNGQLAVG